MSSRKEILFFVNIIAPYNIPLFNRLATAFGNRIHFSFDQAKEGNRNWVIPDSNIQFSYTIEQALHIERTSTVANGAALNRTIYFPFYILGNIWRLRPKVILTIEFGLRTIFSIVAGKMVGAKVLVVSDVTGTTESGTGTLRRLMRKLLVRFSDGAVARSYAAKNYLTSLGYKDATVLVAPYAAQWNLEDKIRIEHFDPVAISNLVKGKFCLFYSGHFTHLKGIDLLVNAVAGLPDAMRANLVVLMAGGDSEALAKVAPHYDQNIFVPLGFIPNQELYSLYKMADCFILPTRSDTWGLVVNEAVAAGCPVMLSKHAGSAGELIEDNVTGIVFDPLSIAGFTRKLSECISDTDRLRNFAIAAQEKLSEYNNEVAANRFIAAIEHAGNLQARII